MTLNNEIKQRELFNAQDVVRIKGRDLGRWPVFHMLFMLLSAVVAANGLIALGTVNFKVNIENTRVGSTPVTRFVPLDPTAPRFEPALLDTGAVVILAHGFSGSQQLMWPLASTFARHGYAAVTFDFPGSGAHHEPFVAASSQRVAALADVVTDTCARWPGKPVVLLGHSMGSAVAVTYARNHPDIAATIAISLGIDAPPNVRNLLLLSGALETQELHEQNKRSLAARTAEQVEPGRTYGAFDDGTAGRVVFVERSEHLLALWHGRSMVEALRWVDQVVGTQRSEPIMTDIRMPAIAVVVLGAVWFWWSLCYFLFRRRRAAPVGGNLSWPAILVINGVALLLAPLLLRLLPGQLLPLAIGSSLVLHFALYGLLLLAGLQLAGSPPWPALRGLPWIRTVGAMLLFVAFVALTLGIVTQFWWLNMWPPLRRIPWAFATFALLLPFFIADAWLTGSRQPGRTTRAFAVTKLCLVGSLVLAVVLNPDLSFLLFIVPAILATLALFGLMGARITRRTGNPFPAALASAALLAWLITVTFPLIR